MNEKHNGYTNFETFIAANILNNYKYHYDISRDAINRICTWDSEDGIIIEKTMSFLHSHFEEIADTNLARDTKWTESDMKHAIGDLINAARARINYRELATELYQWWKENHPDSKFTAEEGHV